MQPLHRRTFVHLAVISFLLVFDLGTEAIERALHVTFNGDLEDISLFRQAEGLQLQAQHYQNTTDMSDEFCNFEFVVVGCLCVAHSSRTSGAQTGGSSPMDTRLLIHPGRAQGWMMRND